MLTEEKRVKVEEFKAAGDAFPGVVVTECWFEPEKTTGMLRSNKKPCAACALTVVGLARGYYTFSDLLANSQNQGQVSGFVERIWIRETSQRYTESFVMAFDEYDIYDDGEIAKILPVTVDSTDADYDYECGNFDGSSCRVCFETEGVKS